MTKTTGFWFALMASLTIWTAGAATAQAPEAAARGVQERIIPEYRLGAGDKVRVIVFGEQSLSGEFFVSGSGTVSFPLIGEVPAAGRQVSDLQEGITARLKDDYLREPKVSVEVLTYRPFYILGEVNRPGEYPYTNSLTVMNAVATAQGFTYRADTKRVFVKRANETAEQPFPLTSSTQVAPGDTIRIGERFF